REKWFEWGVALDREQFVWACMRGSEVQSPRSVHSLESGFDVPCGLMDVLPDRFTLETCPAAIGWWQRAADLLRSGKLLAIDYGVTQEELITPERANGTLRAYRCHHLSPDVLAEPGQQDLTAHVNFTALQRCGKSAGLKTEALVTQSQFLTS